MTLLRTNSASERFSEHLRLFHLRTVHLGANHGTEWNFCAELLRYGECERCLARSGCTHEEEGPSRELARFDEVDDDATCLRVVSVNDTRVIKPLDRGHM